MLDQYFKLTENGTSVRTEIIAGVTTFLTLTYIMIVNPSILAETGMDHGAVFVATCLAAAVGTMIMGVVANYPVAVAPGMGLNAYFAFGVVLGMGHSWQVGLGAVFLSPLVATIPAYATAPTLLFVASVMTRGLSEIDWEDVTAGTTSVTSSQSSSDNPRVITQATKSNAGVVA